MAGEPEVGQNLGLVDGKEAFGRLQFDDDRAIDDKVEPEAALELEPLELHGHRDLLAHLKAPQFQLRRKASAIDAFEEAWPEDPLDLEGASQDAFG